MAAQHPEKRFAVVIDKTSDPGLTPGTFSTDWPKNIKLLETISLTKHQRGGRGYFYGLVLAHGLDVSKEQSDALLQENRGEMTVNSWIGMPKVTKAEVLSRRNKVVEMVRSTVQSCQTLISEAGLIIEPYSYYFFLYPNPEIAKKVEESNLASNTPEKRDKKAKSILNTLLDKNQHPSIETGDSFNLNNTRITHFVGVQMDGVAEEYPDVIRVSPGINTPTEELIGLVQEYAKAWMIR